jgi:hypothetical protein
MADSWQLIPGSSVVLAVHAALLPNGKVLYFSGNQHREGVEGPFDSTQLWDPVRDRQNITFTDRDDDATVGV